MMQETETETETPKAAYVLISKEDIKRLRRVETEGRRKCGCTNHFVVVYLDIDMSPEYRVGGRVLASIDWETTDRVT
jgi:hypothetical protein